jgi:hypothetical protein
MSKSHAPEPGRVVVSAGQTWTACRVPSCGRRVVYVGEPGDTGKGWQHA